MSALPKHTAADPHLVVNRLRTLSGPQVGRRDHRAVTWINQAADLISSLAQEKVRLSMLLSNYTRSRVRVLRVERPVRKVPKVGVFVPNSDPRAMAIVISDCTYQPVDLYRTNRGIRVMRQGQPFKFGEYLGRFDEGATVDDIKGAIE